MTPAEQSWAAISAALDRWNDMGRKMKLTPETSIEALEARFEKGVASYGEKAWNATSDQSCLDNYDFISDRMTHAAQHMRLAWEKLRGITDDDGDDDGAAIMWFGAMLSEARRRRLKQTESSKAISECP
jgi:hypothetical protein